MRGSEHHFRTCLAVVGVPVRTPQVGSESLHRIEGVLLLALYGVYLFVLWPA